ncbi:MAG: hypothetical protein ABI977_02120 [Acidobacteriota bacterium]
MILNTNIFTATIEAAKTAAANRPDVLRAIDRAVVEITRAAYWSFDGQTLVIISTTSKKTYRIDAAHTCEARTKHCKHNIARLLMVRYTERLSAAVPAPVTVPTATKPAAPVITPSNAPLYRPRPRGAQVDGWDV